MKISHLNILIIHSLVGKNDGVSIVIDQTVEALVNHLKVKLGRIFFLAAHSSPRFNTITDDIFWHKNTLNKEIVKTFCLKPSCDLDSRIETGALYARDLIAKTVKENGIDLIIAHNTSHPYNFITAVGLGYFLESQKKKGLVWPKVLVWWHDSYFERDSFNKPNDVVKKYLKYLPGVDIDGIVFINKQQPQYAKKHYQNLNASISANQFEQRTIVIPNTCDITWDWKGQDWESAQLIYPKQDPYNDSFFHDIGLLKQIAKRNFSLSDTVVLLQHTRIVARKRIELAIDFAFKLERKFKGKKCIALLISGPSGDEQVNYKNFLKTYIDQKHQKFPKANVVLVFGESRIISHKDIIVDRKFYAFKDVPSIVAAHGGLGTYFSEQEGYGNNLLEMLSSGLLVVLNKYEIYKQDIEPLGFDLPGIENCVLTDKVVDQAFTILTDIKARNKLTAYNMSIIEKKLHHKLIARKLKGLFKNIFFRA